MPKKFALAAVAVAIVLAAVTAVWVGRSRSATPAQTKGVSSPNGPSENAESSPTPEFDKSKHSLSESDSIWVVVNKQRPLADGYVPGGLRVPNIPLRLSADAQEMQLRPEAAAALELLYAAAKAEGLELMLASGYRSQSFQSGLYNRYVQRDGQAQADTYSARPGHSEHQTGLGADVAPASGTCVVEDCFADTPEGQWVAQHSHKYGFIVRYPKGKDHITGYQYEPWHLRYVGQELAGELQQLGLTMEEFFELPPATSYQ